MEYASYHISSPSNHVMGWDLERYCIVEIRQQQTASMVHLLVHIQHSRGIAYSLPCIFPAKEEES